MHEFSTMQSIVNTILDKLRDYKVQKIEKVVLEIGKLTFLGKEQLKFAFEVLSKDTVLEGASLEIVEIEPVVECEACGYKGGLAYEENIAHVLLPTFKCPMCNAKVKIVRGKECVIRSVEIETEE